MIFNKDSYIWFSSSGEIFNAFDCDHNGAAIHNIWAREHMLKLFNLDGDFFDNFDTIKEILDSENCEYPYEYLEKLGWVRYLPWAKRLSLVEKRKYNKVLKDTIRFLYR